VPVAVSASSSSDETRLRIRLIRGSGQARVATGLPVLDHLLGVLALWGGFDLELETAPSGGGEQEVEAVGRALGRELRALLHGRGYGSATAPADEALAQVVVEASGTPLLATNVDLTGEHVAGLRTDLLAVLLEELCGEAGLTLHVRLLEGEEAPHVLEAVFKALGLALGQACTPIREGGDR
jgi:imidazoleglycerol-phosphate dehydratase